MIEKDGGVVGMWKEVLEWVKRLGAKSFLGRPKDFSNPPTPEEVIRLLVTEGKVSSNMMINGEEVRITSIECFPKEGES